MIYLVLVKKDMLQYVLNGRAVRGRERVFSDHHVDMCKVRLIRAWIKRREMVCEATRIRSEKPREHQHREGYARSLEKRGEEWYVENNFEHM